MDELPKYWNEWVEFLRTHTRDDDTATVSRFALHTTFRRYLDHTGHGPVTSGELQALIRQTRLETSNVVSPRGANVRIIHGLELGRVPGKGAP